MLKGLEGIYATSENFENVMHFGVYLFLIRLCLETFLKV